MLNYFHEYAIIITEGGIEMLKLYENIKKKRIEIGMSQEELALKVGYKDRSMIAKVEKGDVDLSQSKIRAFAKALETSPSDLMGWEDAGLIADMIVKNDSKDLAILKRYNRLSEYQKKIIDSMISEMLKEE
jgi:predicted transcriptional regulator